MTPIGRASRMSGKQEIFEEDLNLSKNSEDDSSSGSSSFKSQDEENAGYKMVAEE